MKHEKLAIHGGQPMLTQPPPDWPVAGPEIREALVAALKDGSWGKYESDWSASLVEKLQRQFEVDHVLPVCSGTLAVEMALRCGGVAATTKASVESPAEVIMAGYDFPGNFRAIEAIGATPVLVDVVGNGWVIDSASVADAITSKTRAILVSHLHGQIADINSIRQIVDQHNGRAENQVLIVEDACQVPGGTLGGKPLGSLGDVGVISFGGSKLLSAGRGGAIVTDSAELFQRAKIFNGRGNEAFPLSQLGAIVLGPQVDQLKGLTQLRNRNALRLLDATSETVLLKGLKQIVSLKGDEVSAWYKVPWLLNASFNEASKEPSKVPSRVDVVAALQAEGVSMDVGFRGFLRRSPRRCRQIGDLVNSQLAAEQTLLLHHPILLESEATVDRVGQAINKVAAWFADLRMTGGK